MPCLANATSIFLFPQDIHQANKIFEGILRDDPQNIRLRSAVGRLSLHLGDLRAASRRFNQVIEQLGEGAEKSPVVLANKALFAFAKSRLGMWRQGDIRGAQPLCPPPFSLCKDDYKLSLSLWQQVLAIEPTNPVAVNNAAVSLLHSGSLVQVS